MKIQPCSKFSPFGHNGSDSGSLPSQSTENGSVTVSRLKPYFNNVLFLFSRVSFDHTIVHFTENVCFVLFC